MANIGELRKKVVTVETSRTELAPANPNRSNAQVSNNGDYTFHVGLGDPNVSATQGTPLPPGATLFYREDEDGIDVKGPIYAIATGGNGTAFVRETGVKA